MAVWLEVDEEAEEAEDDAVDGKRLTPETSKGAAVGV